jgi:hypothetical protein
MWAMAGLCSIGTACAGAHAPAGSHATARPVPAFARTVVLTPVSGRVLIRLPAASSGFVRLSAVRVVAVGTVVDTTAGRVSLTSATPPPGYAQTGQFFRGIFTVEQNRADAGLVNLVIRDPLKTGLCSGRAAHSAALSQRVLGLLRGVAKGRFRTTGRFSSATVRGTDWGVRDRCDGTLTVVREGVVVVRDFRLKKTVAVPAGHTYLAKAA